MKSINFRSLLKPLGILLVAVTTMNLAVWARSPAPQPGSFRVNVENNYSEALTINRVSDGDDRHAVKVMAPGESLDLNIQFKSDQVFLIWHKGRIVDKPIVFEPQKFGRIGITIDQNRRVTTQVAGRQ